MTDHSHHTRRFSVPRWQWIPVVFLIAIAAALSTFAMFSSGPGAHPFVSSEVHFTDASPSGLSIVPASCPSDPFDADSPYGCSGGGGPTPACLDGTPAPDGDVALCTCAQGNVSQCEVCPDGSLAPNNDASQCTCAQGNTSQCSGRQNPGSGGNCPQGLLSEGASCVSACDIGYVRQNNTCVFNSCPLGYVLQGNTCVFTSCPSGYFLQGSTCVANQCSPGYTCSGSNLYYQTGSCSQSLVQNCSYGCSVNACLPTPPPTASLTASPSIVKKGETSQIVWNTQYVVLDSCSVSGTNGDSWGSANGTEVSSPINAQVIYTLTCMGLNDSTVTKQITVNIVPTFQEQ